LVDQRLLNDLAATMFGADERGRLVGHAPLLHILRTRDTVICRCHADLPDEVAAEIERIAWHPRGRPREWSHEYAGYVRLLSTTGPLKAIRAGPLYSFPDQSEGSDEAVGIHEGNADLLMHGLDEWRPDVVAGRPMAAMVVDGRAVSICTSVIASEAVHCAGVETLPEFRGRALATKAVASWARAVQARGSAPFYGTTFDNLASQGVARRLDLSLAAAEFSIECDAS
jgi:hypothetical protein